MISSNRGTNFSDDILKNFEVFEQFNNPLNMDTDIVELSGRIHYACRQLGLALPEVRHLQVRAPAVQLLFY